jgi:NAD(P)-dependent dehydrogenase (short-subunit alcohol dehydrogenase family)
LDRIVQESAWITGGAGGLGLAVGRALLEAGHAVVLLDLSKEAAARAAADLGKGARGVGMDVTDRRSVEAALAETGAPFVLVNGAGIAESRALVPPDDLLWQRTLAVNATGPWIVSTSCLPAMLKAGRGRIVNVASTAGLRAYRYTAAYTASKHALVGLTRAMAEDLRGKGVTVNAVCPGFMDTPMTDRTVGTIAEKTGRGETEARATVAAMNPSGRLVEPKDVAAAIVALVRDGTRTGETVVLE